MDDATTLYWVSCNRALPTSSSSSSRAVLLDLRRLEFIESAHALDLPAVLSAMWGRVARLCQRLHACVDEQGGSSSVTDGASAAHHILDFLIESGNVLDAISDAAREQVDSLEAALEKQAAGRQQAAGASTAQTTTDSSLGGEAKATAKSSVSGGGRAKPAPPPPSAGTGTATAAADSDEVVACRRHLHVTSLLLVQVGRSRAILSFMGAANEWTGLVDHMARDEANIGLEGPLMPGGGGLAAAVVTQDSLIQGLMGSRELCFALEATLGSLGPIDAVYSTLRLISSPAVGEAGRHSVLRPPFTVPTLLSCIAETPRAFCQTFRVRTVCVASRIIRSWTQKSASGPLEVRSYYCHSIAMCTQYACMHSTTAGRMPAEKKI